MVMGTWRVSAGCPASRGTRGVPRGQRSVGHGTFRGDGDVGPVSGVSCVEGGRGDTGGFHGDTGVSQRDREWWDVGRGTCRCRGDRGCPKGTGTWVGAVGASPGHGDVGMRGVSVGRPVLGGTWGHGGGVRGREDVGQCRWGVRGLGDVGMGTWGQGTMPGGCPMLGGPRGVPRGQGWAGRGTWDVSWSWGRVGHVTGGSRGDRDVGTRGRPAVTKNSGTWDTWWQGRGCPVVMGDVGTGTSPGDGDTGVPRRGGQRRGAPRGDRGWWHLGQLLVTGTEVSPGDHGDPRGRGTGLSRSDRGHVAVAPVGRGWQRGPVVGTCFVSPGGGHGDRRGKVTQPRWWHWGHW